MMSRADSHWKNLFNPSHEHNKASYLNRYRKTMRQNSVPIHNKKKIQQSRNRRETPQSLK